jgi:hypothetical protein
MKKRMENSGSSIRISISSIVVTEKKNTIVTARESMLYD